MPRTPDTRTLLLAHADDNVRDALSAQLDLDGYSVYESTTADSTVRMLERATPTAILLGTLERPAASAEVLRALRAGRIDAIGAALPVVTLGATDEVAQVRAYEDGSDHHLASDVPYVILRSIIAAVIRRSAAPNTRPGPYEFGPLSIDVATREVRVDGETIQLPAREFELLRVLASDPERVFTKRELLSEIWGYTDPSTTRTLDSHACRLRGRIAAAGREGMVRNHWGVGYRLAP